MNLIIMNCMVHQRKIELLSPARNLECGLAAISHGADAVYIGGPKFGAREAVGNSVQDIEKLASEAHLFGTRVYVALNTILYDEELESARQLINQVYNAGADALIIQDMGILEMDLPPIPLHASTQVHNFTPSKIEFLEKVGFKRAVLARELTLEQICEIKSRTSIELESFVHGSLCVSLSGQCYLSHAIGGRSANRGACAQPCRKKYHLTDSEGNILIRDKSLLSLKDLNNSASIEELADAGISSFKIEGRLKDVDYVKNITSFYRKKIDAILEVKSEYKAASAGKIFFDFDPDPRKSFNRGSTDYFLHGRSKNITSPDTPKSLGEEIGIVTLVHDLTTGKLKDRKDSSSFFEIESAIPLSNNDGLVFLSKKGESIGLKINQVEDKRIFPDKMNGIYQGASVYRNYDHCFREKLKSDQTARKIRAEVNLRETGEGFSISAADETGLSTSVDFKIEKQEARDQEKSKELIKKQLSKSGDTVFEIISVETNGCEPYFFQASMLNLMRREVLEKLADSRKQKPEFNNHFQSNSYPFPLSELEYQANVSNRLAKRFYSRHGVPDPGIAFEKQDNHQGQAVMITKHCLKYQMGYCRRYDHEVGHSPREPMYLVNESVKLRLEFDCQNCRMKVFIT
jgi:23S rRNA 5-hydroxycytidine C2501 synthase